MSNDITHIAIRIELCKTCDELNSLKFCKSCNCFMPAKVRLKWASCPLGKWDAVGPAPVMFANKNNMAVEPDFLPPNDGKTYAWNPDSRSYYEVVSE